MNIQALANQYLQKLGRIPFVFILMAISLFFWLNGPSFFPDWEQSYGTVIIYYIGMLLIFYVFSTTQTERKMDVPLNMAIFQFTIGFFISFFILLVLVKIGILTPGLLPSALVIPTLIMQFCIVAPAEELMFRGVLQSYTGIFVQAVLFALWHSYAYGILWYQVDVFTGIAGIFIAFLFGLLMGVLSRHPMVGLPGTIAIHATYNLVILGALIP